MAEYDYSHYRKNRQRPDGFDPLLPASLCSMVLSSLICELGTIIVRI